MIANKLCFSTNYYDCSDVEFAVGLQSDAVGSEIVLEHINTVDFPLERLNWLIECLQRIKAEVTPNDEAHRKDAAGGQSERMDPVDVDVMHCFESLERASKYQIRPETNETKAARVLFLANGHTGDVVGMNDTMRLYSCFSKGGTVMYVDYDA